MRSKPETCFQIRVSTLALATLSAAVLAACSREPEKAPAAPAGPAAAPVLVASGPQTVYACDSGKAVSIGYPDPATVQLTHESRTQVLTMAAAPSGTRYVGAQLEWRTTTNGDREVGMLSRLNADGQVGSVLERCSRPATAPVVPTPCTNDQLRLSLDGGDAGMGNRVSVMALANAGPTACTVGGYPDVTVLDSTGTPLTNVVSERGPNNYFNSGGSGTEAVASGQTIVLAARAKAVFDLAWNVMPHEGDGETVCPTATAVRVSVAEGTPLRLAQTFTPCGGRVRVSPLRAPDTQPN